VLVPAALRSRSYAGMWITAAPPCRPACWARTR